MQLTPHFTLEEMVFSATAALIGADLHRPFHALILT
jgi:hypothetical protein